MAFASHKTEAEIESDYRQWCKENPSIEGGHFDEPPESYVDELMESDVGLADQDPAYNLLSSIQQETSFLDPEMDSDDPVPVKVVDSDADVEHMADKEDMKKMLDDSTEEVPAKGDVLPGSLLEAMNGPGCKWNALFRWAVRLRSSTGGCDRRWLPNPRGARRISLGLNWYQLLGMIQAAHFVAQCVI